MEKHVAKFRSHREAEEADRAYYRSLTPEERLEILFELVRNAHDPPEGFKRVYRFAKLERR